MSVVVGGVSHRVAELAALEALALSPEQVDAVLERFRGHAEAVVLSTCNRVEVYAACAEPDIAAERIWVTLSAVTGRPVVRGYLHTGQAAARHLFLVACGLDSMLVGEEQIRGQVRQAYQLATVRGLAGRELHSLFQRALRLGKRAQTELAASRASGSLVELAIDLAAKRLGCLAGRSALLVGAGATGSTAGEALRRAGAGELLVVNRTLLRANQLAERIRGTAVPFDRLRQAIAGVDIVVSSTAARGRVLPAAFVEAALPGRCDRPLVLLDLAMPHDVDPAVRALPGVELINLDDLGWLSVGRVDRRAVDAVSALVDAEVAGYLTDATHAEAGTAINALHELAQSVVSEELARLYRRVPHLTPQLRAEMERTARRIARKLLHGPTVRARNLTGRPGGERYLEAIGELFGPVGPSELEESA